MTILDNDEMIDLGAISVETRGIKQLGEPDFEDGDHYGLVGAISTDDCKRAAGRRAGGARPQS